MGISSHVQGLLASICRSMQVTLHPPYLTAMTPRGCRLSLSAFYALTRGSPKLLGVLSQDFEG